jgi:hypothetical protein
LRYKNDPLSFYFFSRLGRYWIKKVIFVFLCMLRLTQSVSILLALIMAWNIAGWWIVPVTDALLHADE